MDCLHHALFEELEKLSTVEDEGFADAFCGFARQLEYAFRVEEAWMSETDCPSALMHLEEHARALAAVHHVHSSIMAGDIALGREVAEDILPQWLAFHTATMDSGLARSMGDANKENDFFRQHNGETQAWMPH